MHLQRKLHWRNY